MSLDMYRPLGRTGVQVSKLCLGTMMFGAWGNTDHDDSIRIIHRALDAGINFVDTADVYGGCRRNGRGRRSLALGTGESAPLRGG
jgi:aryl-alcohol dehydrogenase-like predicted oxidoreductase